jgi:hypothetical protein
MKNIIYLASQDWEMGCTDGIRARYWMQRGGLGRGGATKQIHARTWQGLLERHIIEKIQFTNPIPSLTEKYQLTLLGKELAKNLAEEYK